MSYKYLIKNAIVCNKLRGSSQIMKNDSHDEEI